MWWSCSIWNPLCPPPPPFFLLKHFYDDLDESWFLSFNVGSSPSNCSHLLDNIHCLNPSSDWGGGVGGVVQSSYILKIKSLWKTNKCSLVKKKRGQNTGVGNRSLLPFSRESSLPSNWTWVSCIAGGLFTSWASTKPLRTALVNFAGWIVSATQ